MKNAIKFLTVLFCMFLSFATFAQKNFNSDDKKLWVRKVDTLAVWGDTMRILQVTEIKFSSEDAKKEAKRKEREKFDAEIEAKESELKAIREKKAKVDAEK